MASTTAKIKMGWRNTKTKVGGFFTKTISLGGRRSPYKGIDSWHFVTPTYTKKDLLKMAVEIPEIFGSLQVQVNAAIGEYTFYTTDEVDDETKNKDVIAIEEWAEDPRFKFETFLRNAVYSVLLRDNLFVELIPKKNTTNKTFPYMVVLDASKWELKYTEDKKKIAGLGRTNTVLDDNASDVVYKYDYLNPEFVFSSMNNFDGQPYGVPPLWSMVQDANIYKAMLDFIEQYYKKGGVGRHAFVMKSGGKDGYERMVEDLKQSKTNMMGIQGDINIVDLSKSPKDMIYKEVRDQFVQALMTLMQVPPLIMSRPGASFKETSKSEINAFASKVRAIQRCIENVINQCIIYLHGKENIRFKLKPWVDPVTQSEIHRTYSEIGVYTPDDILRELGLPGKDWGQIPFNYNLWPQIAHLYDSKIPAPEPTTPFNSATTDEFKSFLRIMQSPEDFYDTKLVK